MRSQLFAKPLPVGKTGSYTFTVQRGWLAGQAISLALVESTDVTITSFDFTDNVIQFFATGVTAGRATVKLSYQTGTRSDCYAGILDVVNC